VRQDGTSIGPESNEIGQQGAATDRRTDREPDVVGTRNRAAKESSGARDNNHRYGKLYALGEDAPGDYAYSMGTPEKEFVRFQERLRRGRVKLCTSCGGVMGKSSRMILSPLSALLLIVVGTALMAFYGLSTNFYQTPWFIKFSLPAVYYIGSILVAVGILFFFIREKVWKCDKCRDIRKR
jgi:hypothetical protein